MGWNWIGFLFIALGVIFGVLFPVLAAQVRSYFPAHAGPGGIPDWIKRYLVLLLFGLVAAVILSAIWAAQHQGQPVSDWFTAFLWGYSGQATIDAFFRPKP
jgi:hypothetical protein